ncbi:MAG: hypothetical protein AAGC56_11335 [Pseudomonadota bacterium]
MTRWITILAAAALAASCATAARYTIEDRLAALGLSDNQAECMGRELSDRLSSDDLQDVARYTLTLSRADTPGGVVDALRGIDNPRAFTAIGQSGLACIFAGF